MQADLILSSSQVFTGLETSGRPGAVALAGDRILFAGPLDRALAFAGPATAIRDFGDAFIMPGFHDSHLHFFHSALYRSPLALTYVGESEEDCAAALARLARRRPPGSWLLSQGWREYRWKNPQMPSKHSLDRAYPDRPVALYSGDAHTLWVNSKALEVLGLYAGCADPEGGCYDRDADGELTGIIREAAAMELMQRILGDFSAQELEGMYRDFAAHLNSLGITSVCDLALSPYPDADFIRDDIYTALEAEGRLTVRAHLFPTLSEDLGRLEALQGRLEGPLVRACGFKQFFDGVSSQHTAYLTDPYTNARFPGERGSTTIGTERMRTLVLAAAQAGHAVRIHTIGDGAIHAALDIFEEARAAYGPPASGQNCLEHVENFLPDDIARMQRLDVLAAVQPPHITLDPGGPEEDLGMGRIRWMWPFRSLLDAGAKLSFGTDSPVVPPDPLAALYAAVTRKDPTTHLPDGGWLPEERIGRAEALRAYTFGSAQAAGRAHELGTLEAGKLADVAVLDQNLLDVEEDRLQDVSVIATYMGGRCVYEA